MAIVYNAASDGQLPNAKGTIYTVGAATEVGLYITLVNTSGSAVTATVYVQRGGSDRQIFKGQLAASGGSVVLKRAGLALKVNHLVRGDDGGAGGAAVDYTVSTYTPV